MFCTKEAELKQQLGANHRVYFLYGDENYLIERYAAQLTARFGGGFGAFNLQRFSGKKPDLDEIWAAVEAMPLMAPEKCVVIDDLDAAKLNAADLKKLGELMAAVPEECTLLVTAKAPGFDAKSANGKKLISLVDKTGLAAALGARSQTELAAFIKKLTKHGGCDISTEAAKHLLHVCGTDMGTLAKEVEKLCACAGFSGEITAKLIDSVAVPRTEARVFDLSKALLAGDAQKALEILDALFYMREQAAAILAVLTMSFVDLYRARVAKEEGKSPADVVALFGYKGREFRVTGAFSACSRFSAHTLRRVLGILYTCDRALKSSATDDRVLLEQAVLEIYTTLQKA